MQLTVHTTVVKPSKDHSPLLEQVGIQEHTIENVAYFTFDENKLWVRYNDGTDQQIPLRGNDGENSEDWRGCSIYVTRKFLELDLSK